MKKLLSELVDGVSHLQAPVKAEVLCRELCGVMARRRGKPIEFRTSSFPPGTASGLWISLGDRDLVVVEKRTQPVHQIVITGHELRHMDQGHCSRHLVQGAAATRLLSHEPDLAATVEAILSVAGRHSPIVADQSGSPEDEYVEHEKDAERFGILLATRVGLMLDGEPEAHDPLADRIQMAFGYRSPRG
ncbi:toxin-antitoxin system, toxin component [Streptomyces sp. NPDC096205]|uniref:toxin-antitoxin system, toxin component n=1 Tax=Streptomyces sp. NPDC096205 TaxID=3366081 RepID=UPI0037F3B340